MQSQLQAGSVSSMCKLAVNVMCVTRHASPRSLRPHHPPFAVAPRAFTRSHHTHTPFTLMPHRSYHATLKLWMRDVTSFFGVCFSAFFIAHGSLRL